MCWAKHHKQSESYANDAETALISGESEIAVQFYCLAAEAEATALDNLDPYKVRTMGITAVSATARWHKAGDFQQSKKIAERCLAHHALPSFAVDQLKKLVEDCNESLSLNKAN